MSEILDQVMMNAATSLMRQKEQIIMDCVSGISLSEIKRRCRVEICDGVETIVLDGRPILEFHRVDLGEPVFDESTQSYKQTITQKFRRL